MIFDLIIIGAGPAGIAASLYAARQNLNFLIISKDIGGQANLIPDIETYLGYHYITGSEIVKRFQEHLKDYNVRFVYSDVKKLEKQKDCFVVRTNITSFRSRVLVIATGRVNKKLKVKGESEYANKGLSYCAACDGPLFKNKTVAVIGGGKSGLFSTFYILKISQKIYLIEENKELTGPEFLIPRILKHEKVEILTNTKVLEVIGNKIVNKLKVKQGNKIKTLPLEGIFVEIGYEPNLPFLNGLVKINNKKEIVVDKECSTSMQGIFAAGDVTDINEKQVIVAAGEGAKALMSALTYLAKYKK